MIPLEVIYRNFLPPGSSVFKRLKDGEIKPQDLGLDRIPVPTRIWIIQSWSKISEFLTLLLSQLKRGYAGLAVIERFNSTFRFSIQSLNFQIDPPVSGQPELKKSISQGGHRLID